MTRTMNESVLDMLMAIYKELEEIKNQLKSNNEIEELKQRLELLENKVSMLESWKTIDKPFTNPYQPPIMFDNDVPPSSPLFPQVIGSSENISELSKEIDSNMPKYKEDTKDD